MRRCFVIALLALGWIGCAADDDKKPSTPGASSPPPATKDCATFIAKCTSCGDTNETCTKSCEVHSADCTACVLATTGCAADECLSRCEVKP